MCLKMKGSFWGMHGSQKLFHRVWKAVCLDRRSVYEARSRGLGIGSKFLIYRRKYADVVVRLEVEEENERAVHVYKKAGYEVLPYMEMIRK